MKIARIKSESGMTLLEVLIAMLILSTSLLVLLNMAMVALDANEWSRNTTTTMQLVQEKLEQLRTANHPLPGQDTVATYVRTWTVDSVAHHLREVNITVTWVDMQNQVQVDSLSTFLRTDAS